MILILLLLLFFFVLLRFLTGLSMRECGFGSQWSRKCTPWRYATRRAKCLQMANAVLATKTIMPRPQAHRVALISTHRCTSSLLSTLSKLLIAWMGSCSLWDSIRMLGFTFRRSTAPVAIWQAQSEAIRFMTWANRSFTNLSLPLRDDHEYCSPVAAACCMRRWMNCSVYLSIDCR